MTNEEKAKKIVKETEDFFYHNEQERGLACALRMAKWKEQQLKKRVEKVLVSYKYLLSDNVNPRAVKEHLAQRLIEFMVMTKLVEIKEVQNDDEATIFMQVNVLKEKRKK